MRCSDVNKEFPWAVVYYGPDEDPSNKEDGTVLALATSRHNAKTIQNLWKRDLDMAIGERVYVKETRKCP